MDTNGTQEGMVFEILRSVLGDAAGARLGRLRLPGRNAIETPNFFSVASRGSVPHLSPDNVSRYSLFGGCYMGLEDCKNPHGMSLLIRC